MRREKAFTLIELMVVVAILALLTQVALATYVSFTTRSAYTEIVLAAQGYRRAVDVCVLSLPMASCNSGSNGIPASKSSQAVSSVAVVEGVITVTPNAYKGLTSDDVYVLTPIGGGNGQNVSDWVDNCDTNQLC